MRLDRDEDEGEGEDREAVGNEEEVMAMAIWRRTLMGLGLSALAALPGNAGAQAPSRTEVKLERQIDARLTADEALGGKRLAVDVRGETVILSGQVASEGERRRAEQLALVDGVAEVDNQIVVVPPARTGALTKEQKRAREDAALAREQARRAALADPRRADPMVGQMPQGNAGSKEMTLRTTGMPYVPEGQAPATPSPDAGAR
jgi:hypothetical protein